MRRIGIVDVGIGNIGSLKGAVYELGFDPVLIQESSQFSGCDNIILPGVGSFYHGMQMMGEANMFEPIQKLVSDGTPLLGICLGMQLLFDQGDEGGEAQGLSLIHGSIQRFQDNLSLRLPHVGWNEVHKTHDHPVWNGIKQGVDFYFVHSYVASCSSSCVLGTTEYGEVFPSFVATGTSVGMQFHPEKSQKNGLKMLENFCNWDGSC
jgi:imidazole glycerol-phosphate synthase subunit HisH